MANNPLLHATVLKALTNLINIEVDINEVTDTRADEDTIKGETEHIIFDNPDFEESQIACEYLDYTIL
jgi:hypothetical protein